LVLQILFIFVAMKKYFILLVVSVTLLMFAVSTGCMPTLITSNTPNADVYVNGKKKGETPLMYNDAGIAFIPKKVRIEKEGFESAEFIIKKNKRVNPFALITLYAAPWSLGYAPYYRGVLKPIGDKEFFKPDCLIESPKHSNKDLKASSIDILSKLDGKYYGYAESGKEGYFVELNKDFKIVESTDILKAVNAKNRLEYGVTSDIFMNKENVYVLRKNPKQSEINLFKFNLNGELVDDFSAVIKQYADKGYFFKSSLSGNYFSIYSGNRVLLFDLDLNQIENVEANLPSSMFVGDDRSMVFLNLEDNEMFLRRILDRNDDVIQLFEEVKHNSFDFSLDVYPELNKIFISSLTNDFPLERKGKFPSGVKGSQVSVVSFDDFEELEFEHILYTDLDGKELLTAETGNKKSSSSYDNTYAYLKNKGVKATKSGYSILNQEVYIVVSDKSSRTVYDDLVITTISEGENIKSKVIRHSGSFIAEAERDYLHFISQSQYGSAFIEHLTLDSKLEVVGYNIKPFRKTKNIVMSGRGGAFSLDGQIQNSEKSIITIFEPKTYRAYTLDYIE